MEEVQQIVGIQETELMPSSSVDAWLESVEMGHYAPVFRDNRITQSHLDNLTDSDLQSMGITILGDRKTILSKLAEKQSKASESTMADETCAVADARKQAAAKFDGRCAWTATVVIFIFAALGLTEGIEGAFMSIFLGIAACIAFYLYSLPAVIAFRRGHEYRWAILIANWLLGITVIVWVVLLCYSLGLFGSGAAVALAYFADRK